MSSRRTTSANEWLLNQVGERPYLLVLVGLFVFLVVVLGSAAQVLHLLNERALAAREHQLQLAAAGLNAIVEAETKRLRLLKSYAENVLEVKELPQLAAADPAVAEAFTARNDPVWRLLPTPGNAPVIGFSPDELQGQQGAIRRDDDLKVDLYMARSLTRVMCALVQQEALEVHAFFISTNGFYSICPADERYQPQRLMRRFFSMPYYLDVLAHPEQAIHWEAPYQQFERDLQLVSLSTPVKSGAQLRGVIVLNMNQQVLNEFLARTTDPGDVRVLVGKQQGFFATRNFKVTPGQKWPTGVGAQWQDVIPAQLYSEGSGRLSRAGDYLLFQRLVTVDCVLIDFVPAAQLRSGIFSQLSSTIIWIATALILMMWTTFAVISRLFTLYRQRGEALRVLAERDPLTGLANRRHFRDRFALEYERRQRHQSPISLLMLDIDHFKQVNDRWGHANGDLVLKTLASVCLEALRAVDLPARLGGEEFAVLLPETGLAEAIAIAERLRLALAAAICTPQPDAASARNKLTNPSALPYPLVLPKWAQMTATIWMHWRRSPIAAFIAPKKPGAIKWSAKASVVAEVHWPR